ncbi:MAG: DNA gyrase inhibitor YacG [Roseovarius sp.]|nr:DNA gyrase inhibitor YacG [Roseovarius sp.]
MACPICKKPTEPKYRPFCSRRCADVDLGKWFSGDYAVPSTDPEDIEEAIEAISQEPQKPH